MLDIKIKKHFLGHKFRAKPLKLFSWPYLSWCHISRNQMDFWTKTSNHHHGEVSTRIIVAFFWAMLPPKSEKVEGIFCIVSFLTAVTVVRLQANVTLRVLLVPWYKEAKRNKRSQCVPVDRANASTAVSGWQ